MRNLSPSRLSRLSRLLVLCALAGLAAPRAGAETVACKEIASLPYVIGSPGAYCLQKSLVTALTSGGDTAIRIEASDVVLDLNGHAVANDPAIEVSLATGILAASGTSNVTIRNGVVRGFFYGVLLQHFLDAPVSIGRLVERMTIDGADGAGISSLGDRGVLIRDNTIVEVGGSRSGSATAFYGIRVESSGGSVAGNRIAGVLPNPKLASLVFGIWATSTAERALTVAGNFVDIGISRQDGSVLDVQAIHVHDGVYVLRNNELANSPKGILVMPGAKAKLGGNLTSNVAIPFIGGNDAGGND